LFTLMVGCIYGLFSGTFAGRAVRLMRLAYQDMPLGRPMLNT
jgi:ABC-type dipeptide/oligopeptide/nickel transport system permease subunit